jgi:hypothetical protein
MLFDDLNYYYPDCGRSESFDSIIDRVRAMTEVK